MINLGSCQGRPGFDSYKMSYKNKKKYKNLEVSHDCIMTLHKKKYVLQIPIEISKKPIIQENFSTYCGVDPGERTLLTAYGNKGVIEYSHNRTLLNSLYNKIAFLKSKNFKNLRKTKNLKTLNKKRKRYGVRKKQINKIEKRIESIINILHWSSINDLVQENDIIYFGDIKTHDIVKDGKNKNLNRNLNSLKFYKYKQRLIFKAIRAGKRVVFVNESYTTQGCSKCGTLWPKIGKSETYYCQNNDCRFVHGRDMNAAKNICMKGMLRA
jgi:IS605 OrfB family transposase